MENITLADCTRNSNGSLIYEDLRTSTKFTLSAAGNARRKSAHLYAAQKIKNVHTPEEFIHYLNTKGAKYTAKLLRNGGSAVKCTYDGQVYFNRLHSYTNFRGVLA